MWLVMKLKSNEIEQYGIETWTVRSMNQGKLEVLKEEMARVNIDILGITELKWTGMGGFNWDDLYIYLEKEMANHSSTLTWKIPWTEEPGKLQSMGSQRVGHNWAPSLSLFTFMHWRRKWQPTPVFLPGESQGRGSPVGCHLWGLTELDRTEATQQQSLAEEGSCSPRCVEGQPLSLCTFKRIQPAGDPVYCPASPHCHIHCFVTGGNVGPIARSLSFLL